MRALLQARSTASAFCVIPREKRFAFQRLLLPPDHAQPFSLENPKNLDARMICPRTDTVELDVLFPVPQGAAVELQSLVGEREIVVCVGVAGSNFNGGAVCLNGL